MKSEAPQSHENACVLGVFTEDPLRLDGLRTLLDEDAYHVIALAAVERLGEHRLSLAMLDVGSGTQLASLLGYFRRVRPLLPVLVLGPAVSEEETMRIVRLGAKGYLNHSASAAELRMALRVALEGSIWAPRKVLARLLADTQKVALREPTLTPREVEVLHLLVGGRSNRAIAESLAVDEATVKAHLGRLMRKLHVRNRIGLSMSALELLRRASVNSSINQSGNERL